MNIVSQTNKIQLVLKQHQLLSLHGANPRLAIGCKDGVLWVTNSSEGGDHILGAGRHYSPKNAGNLVIEAMRDASVDIEER
jgi:hypothetical protein